LGKALRFNPVTKVAPLGLLATAGGFCHSYDDAAAGVALLIGV
jgi:hypothetical protein